uniref:MARVEL domain-containing protein n=1 Tax=viral metagenome TaxID=1070528 RepID=A0A6C0LR96_9ZZZZ
MKNKNMENKITMTLVICFIVFNAISLAIGIISIVMSMKKNQCDNSNLDLNQWLLIEGVSVAIMSTLSLFFIILYAVYKNNAIFITIIIIIIVNALFDMMWFVIGGSIIFNSDISCVDQGITIIIYASIIWCVISAFYITTSCHIISIKSNNIA